MNEEDEYPQHARGHVWKRDSDGMIDWFAGSDYGFHNGPLCLRCGDGFCEHCNPEKIQEDCPAYGAERVLTSALSNAKKKFDAAISSLRTSRETTPDNPQLDAEIEQAIREHQKQEDALTTKDVLQLVMQGVTAPLEIVYTNGQYRGIRVNGVMVIDRDSEPYGVVD